MLNKKNLIILLIGSLIIFLIFLLKNNYKNLEVGNNMSNKSIEEIEEYVLNISSYQAKISVTVNSNKNTNKYIISQKYISPNKSKQTILEPSNVGGIEIINDGTKLIVNNSKLNLNKIYENYEYVVNNCICLESFIADYKENNGNIYEKEGKIILETNTRNQNNYTFSKKLYIDKNTGNIEKLLVEDINEKNLVYILYNEIRINELKENDVLAFRITEKNAKFS